MSAQLTPSPTGIPASTVIIFRNNPISSMPPEILMVQRAKEMRFAGGACVFPGGRIDPADYTLAKELAPHEPPLLSVARIASIRETLEETGLMLGNTQPITAEDAHAARTMLLEQGVLAPVLTRFDWALELHALTYWAHWCPHWEKAFDTYFFIADVGTGAVDIAIDATENTRLFWTTAEKALELADAGEISVIFPTRRNLERLAQFQTFADAKIHAEQTPVQTITPWHEERDGNTYLTIPEDAGYPCTQQILTTVSRG